MERLDGASEDEDDEAPPASKPGVTTRARSAAGEL
jgi:hypothetical protein